MTFASVGGFFTYGFKDKGFKYGLFTQIFPYWYSDTKLSLRYHNGLTESGKISFLDEGSVLKSSDLFREFYIKNFDESIEKEVSFSFRAFAALQFNLFFNHSDKTFYSYAFDTPTPPTAIHTLGFTETGIQMKFAFNEKFMKTPRGMMVSMGTNYPILLVQLY